LIDYLNTRNDYFEYLFTNKNKILNKNTVENVLYKYVRKPYINKHCSEHLFKKTLMTKWYKKGMDVFKITKILERHSVKTTELYHLTIYEEDVRRIYKLLC
jgi:site-specific recombinase XerD